MAAPIPTRRDEAWRYSDMEALARLWPLPAPESIVVPAGGKFARTIVQDEGGVRQIELVLGKGVEDPATFQKASSTVIDVLMGGILPR